MINSEFDPFDELMTARHNIGELIRAVNYQNQRLQDLEGLTRHQQEVIQQIMFQNKKLANQIAQQTNYIQTLSNEVKTLRE